MSEDITTPATDPADTPLEATPATEPAGVPPRDAPPEGELPLDVPPEGELPLDVPPAADEALADESLAGERPVDGTSAGEAFAGEAFADEPVVEAPSADTPAVPVIPAAPAAPPKPAAAAGPGFASALLTPVRVLLDVVVFLGILLTAGFAVLYYVCTYEPRLITSYIEDYLVERTDMPWQLNGAVKPVFSPYPGLRVADVRALAASVAQEGAAKSDKPLLEVRELSLLIAPDSLESFTPRIHLIELDSPVINLAYDEQQRPLWLPPEQPEKAPAPERARGARASAKTAKPAASPPTAKELQTEEDPLKTMADTVCLLPNTIGIPVKIRNGSLRSWSADGKLLLSLQGFDGDFDPTALEENLHLNSTFSLPGADLSLTFSIAATVGYEDIPARGHMTGKLQMRPPGSRMISGTFDTPFTWVSDGRHVALPEFVLRSEGDALSADLLADLAGPSCTGKVTLNKVSLTRWFQFGRSLPPGLREALHNLVGDFDLVLDSKRAEAKNLRGRAGKIAVQGYVGTPNFAKPVVVVDLDIGQANVDPLFPFLAAIGRTVPDPTPPRFDHPPLVPYPADPKAPPSPSSVKVSYDVHIDVAKPTVHDVTGGPLVVTVAPAMVKGVAKTRVGIAAKSIIKGSLTGYIDIDGDSMDMHFEPKDLELGLLPENAMNAVKIAGRVTGQCDIDIPFKKNGDLADDWGIRVDAAIKGCEITGQYGKKNWKLHFGTAKANGRGSIHAVQPDGVRIEGAWDIAGSAINTSWYPGGKDAINGKFNGGLYWLPIHGKKGEKRGVNRIAGSLVADGSLVIPVGKLRPPLKGKLNTSLEWMLYGEKLALRKTTFEGFKSIVKGDLDINYSGKDVLVTGQPSFTLSLYDFLKGWDLVPSDSFTMPKVVTGRTGVKGTGFSLEFQKIKADVDGRAYSGDIFWKDNPRSGDAGLWTFRMNTAFLDLDKFVAVTPPLPKGKRPPLPSKKAWNLKALQDLAFDVELTAQRGKREKLHFSKAKITAAL
ncbi:hypothetical protein LJC46_09555, partial [Desulfovibrio sp. OttesenSCG-928-G15]|nr:hypothetical protein [Desulfovibrio sp. OttesenSCG-928-G15]